MNPETPEQLLEWLMRKRARLQKMQKQFANQRSKRIKDKLLALEMQVWEIEDIVQEMIGGGDEPEA